MAASGWPCQESNLDLEFRKLLFYPLNYRAAKCDFAWRIYTNIHHKTNSDTLCIPVA